MLVNNSKISDYILKKIIKHFVVGIDASKCAKLIDVNRNTINRYYNFFRDLIFEYQTQKFELVTWEI